MNLCHERAFVCVFFGCLCRLVYGISVSIHRLCCTESFHTFLYFVDTLRRPASARVFSSSSFHCCRRWHSKCLPFAHNYNIIHLCPMLIVPTANIYVGNLQKYVRVLCMCDVREYWKWIQSVQHSTAPNWWCVFFQYRSAYFYSKHHTS